MGFFDLFKTSSQKSNEEKDSICRMKVDFEKTKYKSTYQEKTYGFCSEHCKNAFDQNPAQYI